MLQIMQDSEENFAQIHLPNWQFYLPWAVGQCEMSSHVVMLIMYN